MKLFRKLSISALVVIACLGAYSTGTYAYERIMPIDKVNYVSLNEMADKYNLAINVGGKSVSLYGETVNLSVSMNSNIIVLNGKQFLAQKLPQKKEDNIWITAKDWATVFNLALSHYDTVSEMYPAPSQPVANEMPYDYGVYRVSEDWGELVPESVRKHGNITQVNQLEIKQPVYFEKHSSSKLESEDKVQRP